MKNEPMIVKQLTALLANEQDFIANLANAAALLFESLPDINWAGFYRYLPATDELILGPFQGKVACVHIPNGSGVCGTAFQQNQVLRIADVHQFPGHIACDAASRSEIVLPLKDQHDNLIGVLDIDAPIPNRFTQLDEAILRQFVEQLQLHLTNVI